VVDAPATVEAPATVDDADAVRQVELVPARIVKLADGFVRPSESRITSVHDVPAGRFTSHVREVPEVDPRSTRGAAPACPPG